MVRCSISGASVLYSACLPQNLVIYYYLEGNPAGNKKNKKRQNCDACKFFNLISGAFFIKRRKEVVAPTGLEPVTNRL